MLINKIDMEDFVTFEQAQRLKELGFDWEVNQYYIINAIGDIILWFPEEAGGCDFNFIDDGRFSAPTLALAAKWLREVKGIYVEISRYNFNNFAYELKFDYDSKHKYCCQGFMTPETALLRGIDEALEFLK